MRDVSDERLARMARITLAEVAKLRRRALEANSTVPIDDCDTSIRLANILSARGVRTLGDLAQLTVKDMASITHSGTRMVKEARVLLASRGLCFHGDEDWLLQPATG
jgi:DNA-directed RNA polymerase alpha subunit